MSNYKKTSRIYDFSVRNIISSTHLLSSTKCVAPIDLANDNRDCPIDVPPLSKKSSGLSEADGLFMKIEADLSGPIARGEVWRCSMCGKFRINPYGPPLLNTALVEHPCGGCDDMFVTGINIGASTALREVIRRGLL